MNQHRLALAAAGLSGILVGAALVATGSIIDQAGPATVAFMRYLIGVLFLLPLAMRHSWSNIQIRDVPAIFLLGVFQFGVLILLLNFSVLYIEVGLSVLIFATLPLQTMCIAILLKQESFTARKFIGIMLTIAGVGFAVGAAAFNTSLAPMAWMGMGAAFLSALSGAACSVYYRPYLQKYPTIQVSTLSMLASVIFLLSISIFEGLFDSIPQFDLTVWLVLLFIGLSSSVGYFTWLYALTHTLPSNVTVFLGISPISAAIFAALFIAQPLTVEDMIGSAFVAVGLFVCLWQQKPVTSPQQL